MTLRIPGLLLAAALAAAGLSAGLSGCGRGPDPVDSVAAAQKYMAEKDFKAAAISAKNALQIDPRNAQARLLLGQVLLEEDQPTAAEVELRKALELGAADVKTVPLLARAELGQGKAREVTTEYGATVLADAHASADLRTTVATAFTLLGDKSNALEMAQAALKEWPGYAPATLVLAGLAAADGDTERALALVEQVLAQDAKFGRALLLKGSLLQASKNDDGALATYRAAVAAEPKLASAHAEIITMLLARRDQAGAKAQLAQLAKVLPNHPITLLFDARLAYLDGNFTRARDVAERLLHAYPNDWRALLVAGLAEARLGAAAKAETYLAQASKARPDALLPRQALAQLHLRAGRTRDALALLQPVIESKAPDAESLTLAGMAYLQADDQRRAEAAFTQAAKIDAKAVTARRALALGHLAQGNVEGGFAELETLASQDPTARSTLALVAARMARNDLPGALKAIDELQARQPANPVAYALRGSIQARRKDNAAASAAFEKALALDKTYFPAVAGLAALELAAGRPEGAKRRYDDLLREDPKNLRAALALVDLKMRQGATPAEITKALGDVIKDHPTQALPRLMLTDYLLGRNDAKAAVAVAQDAVAALPAENGLLDRLGAAQLAAGAPAQAVTSYTKLAAALPDRAEPLLRLAEAQAAAKDYASAQRALARALELKPGLVPARVASARVALLENKPEAAAEVARGLVREQPQSPTGYLLQADVAGRRGHTDAQVGALRQALEHGGGTEVAARLYHTLAAAQRNDEAERMAAAWLKAHPKDVLIRFQMGDLAMAQGQFAAAEAHYRGVLALQPDNAPALNNVAWLLVRQGKPGAVEMAERANRILPDRPALLDTLAAALAAADQLLRAIDVQKRAVDKAPDDPGLRLNLARLYVKAGDRQLARTQLETLAKLGDKFADHAEVASLLKSL